VVISSIPAKTGFTLRSIQYPVSSIQNLFHFNFKFCDRSMKAKAKAHSNIALIKYWGKRSALLNLPAVGSISVTLDSLHTITTVEFIKNLKSDYLILNKIPADERETKRVSSFLNIIRRKADLSLHAEVHSMNNFPTAAGLASSASAFAALALAASSAAGINLSPGELSVLARRGSGSAARSVFGGFVEMKMGKKNDGSDAAACQIAAKDYWDLHVLIAVTSQDKKKTSSTDGMTLSKDTSPYYQNWLETSFDDLKEMRAAIQKRDFQKLGELSEYNCLKMHALALSGRPGLLYWNGTTVEVMRSIKFLRGQGCPVYFTIDAGPQVKAICQPEDVERVAKELEHIRGVQKVIHTSLGNGAELIGDIR
jgi:diphosphomevalonate decarboxylase